MTKEIGKLNGPWGWLFKIALSTYPFVIAFCVWVVSTLHAHDGELRERPDRQEVVEMVNTGGPYIADRKYILEKLDDIQSSVDRIEERLEK